MKNVISLHERRVKKWGEELDKKIEDVKEEFSFVDNEYLEKHVQDGNVNLESAVKSIWTLAKRMDQLEIEIIKIKLMILEAQQEDKKERLNQILKGGEEKS